MFFETFLKRFKNISPRRRAPNASAGTLAASRGHWLLASVWPLSRPLMRRTEPNSSARDWPVVPCVSVHCSSAACFPRRVFGRCAH